MCKNLRQLSFGEFLRCVVEKGNPNNEFTNDGTNFMKRLFSTYGVMIIQLMKPPKWLYQNGYIYGIKFKSRSHNCRELCREL